MNVSQTYRKKIIFVLIAVGVLMANALIPEPQKIYHPPSVSSNHTITSLVNP